VHRLPFATAAWASSRSRLPGRSLGAARTPGRTRRSAQSRALGKRADRLEIQQSAVDPDSQAGDALQCLETCISANALPALRDEQAFEFPDARWPAPTNRAAPPVEKIFAESCALALENQRASATLTGSVSTINTKDIEDIPFNTVDQAMAGRPPVSRSPRQMERREEPYASCPGLHLSIGKQ